MQVTMTLHRVYEKGKLCFDIPTEPELVVALRDLLEVCQKKNNDFVTVTLKRPTRPRTTGKGSQNHHLNGHIMQICQYTQNDYETIKYCVKMIAVEKLGYSYKEVAGHILPKSERDTDTEECAKLIEAAHLLAADIGLILKESEDV